MLSIHESHNVSQCALEGEATARAPTRGAPTGSFGGVVKMAHEGGEGRHKTCPYGSVSGVW